LYYYGTVRTTSLHHLQYVANLLALCSGIYVPNDDRWPKHFRGMGIRIEDSVCVRENSVLVFTTEAVKEASSQSLCLWSLGKC